MNFCTRIFYWSFSISVIQLNAGAYAPTYLSIRGCEQSCEKWICHCAKSQNTLVLNPLQWDFSRPSPQGRYKGLLAVLESGPVLREGVAVHTEPLLTVAQWALCHLINQKSWPQVAHRSQTRRRVRQKQRKCTPHASPPKGKSITRGVWTARTTPP